MSVEKIGRYEIRAELGRGGMATVYRGYDPRFKREVAVKALPREFLHDPSFRARFEREAETIAALEHPAIVPVYDYGEEDGQPYIVMRLMTGGSLADRLKRGALSLPETGRILSRLAPALDRAHGKGIVHRDLKPGNILFDDDDNPYVSDFGIAKLTEATATFTGTAIVGTPAYMSPEQARGDKAIDARSDIYALGAIVFQMLTGRIPYEADTPMGIVVKHITEPVPSILDTNPDLPPDCDALIRLAMAKDRDQRFATASKMARTLAGTVQAATRRAAPRGPPDARTAIPTAHVPDTTAQVTAPVDVGLPSSQDLTPAAAPPPPAARSRRGLLAAGGLLGLAAIGIVCGLAVATLGSSLNLLRWVAPATKPADAGAAALTPGTTPTGAQATAALAGGGAGQLAFVSNRDGNLEIYLMNADGSEPTRLTHDGAADRAPAWSPDSSRIAFATERDGNGEIYIMNADGSGQTRLTNSPADNDEPAWSPDGTRIAFHADSDGNLEIFVVGTDGIGLRRLTYHSAEDALPAWSPDGSLIAFVSDRDGDNEIYVMTATGQLSAQLTANGESDLSPAWSPDGKKIAFSSRRDGNFEIYVMNSDGSAQTRLTDDPAIDSGPAWSPDGQFIVFASNRDGVFDIYRMRSDGSDLTRLTAVNAGDFRPAWRP